MTADGQNTACWRLDNCLAPVLERRGSEDSAAGCLLELHLREQCNAVESKQSRSFDPYAIMLYFRLPVIDALNVTLVLTQYGSLSAVANSVRNVRTEQATRGDLTKEADVICAEILSRQFRMSFEIQRCCAHYCPASATP